MVVREKQMVGVVAYPEVFVRPEPAIRSDDPQGGVGQPIRCLIHENLAAWSTDSGQAADEVELSEQPTQRYGRVYDSVGVAEADLGAS